MNILNRRLFQLLLDILRLLFYLFQSDFQLQANHITARNTLELHYPELNH